MNGKYERKFVKTEAPAQLKEVKKIPLHNKTKHFKRSARRNKYYRLALCALICIIVFSSGRIYQSSIDKDKYTAKMEAEIAKVVDEYEATILQLNNTHREEIVEIQNDYENLTPEELMKQEAEYIAKVLYGTARNHDARDQKSLIWCILNRVDSIGFPSTVKEVCQQSSQWICYHDDNPILNDLYDVALQELETWHNNYRPVSEDYVYMSWSSKEIKLRDTYEKNDSTRYWQAG